MTQEPKISFVFDRKKRATQTVAGSVELRVYHERKRSYISTGVMLYEGQWATDKVVNRYDATQLNILLKDYYVELNNYVYSYIKQNDMFDVSVLSNFRLDGTGDPTHSVTGGAGKGDPFEWMLQRLSTRVVRESTRGNHERVINDAKRSGLFRSWADFTVANIKLWDDRLKMRLRSQTTVHGYHKRFKLYMREAELFGMIPKNPYSFLRIEPGHSQGIKYITKEERARIEALHLEAGEEKARDLFIFACYTGLSFCDMQKIKVEDIKRGDGHYYIEDRRQKTGTKYHIVLLPQAMAILKKWSFDLNIITNQKANWYLKNMQALAHIETRLTMHVGRHTFATWALSEGIPIEVVSRMLAHSNIAVTQIYAKVLPTKVEQAFAKLKEIS